MKKSRILQGLIIIAFISFLLWHFFLADSQKVFVIGVLNYTKAAEPTFAGFKEGMASMGFIEGQNVNYIYHGFFKDKEQLLAEGRRLIDQKVDLIFSMSTPATLVAKAVTASSLTPVVFGPVNDPIGTGIITDYKHHECNVTGVAFGFQEIKRLEWMTRIVPEARRLFLPFNPNDKSPRISIEKLNDAVTAMGLELVFREVITPQDLEQTLANLPDDIDAVFLPTDSFMAEKTPEFARVAIEKSLPLSCPHRPGVKAGALYSYGFDQEDVGRQAARLAVQILNGIPPKDLPVEMAEFYLSINIETANRIGLNISDDILRQAIIFGRKPREEHFK